VSGDGPVGAGVETQDASIRHPTRAIAFNPTCFSPRRSRLSGQPRAQSHPVEASAYRHGRWRNAFAAILALSSRKRDALSGPTLVSLYKMQGGSRPFASLRPG